MTDANAINATKYGQLGPMIIAPVSVFAPRAWDATNIFHKDLTNEYTPQNGSQNIDFGGTVRFTAQKRATLLGLPHYRVLIQAALLDAGRNAAYVKDLGDQLMRQVTMRYGSNIIQVYPGEFQYVWHRITKHDNHLEARHLQTLGGLAPGGAQEQARVDALIDPQGLGVGLGVLELLIPLDELYFTHHEDEYLMPESLATEVEIEIDLQNLQLLVYSDNNADPFIGVGRRPTITQHGLKFKEITLPVPEKQSRLSVFETNQGQLIKFLDLEIQRFQINGTGGAVPITVRVPLDNIRLDVAEFMFWVRRDRNSAAAADPGINAPWAGDPVESSTTASIVTAASVATQDQIIQFRLESNGKRLYEDSNDLYNRTVERHEVHKDSQVADFIYIIAPALLPEDRKNASNFLNAANLGRLELVIQLNDFAATYPREVTVYAHSHNIVQTRRGDIVKALK